MRLLIVEDDPAIADVLRQALTEEGYGVDHAVTAREGEALTRLFPYDVLILDVMLPEGADAGWTLARTLRAAGYGAPVLFLTARGETDDLVSGFEAGGDDYLAKPFALKELLVRVQALTRRGQRHLGDRLPLPFGWVLDIQSREARHGSTPGRLTQREFRILEVLARHPDRMFTRPELIERVWAGVDAVEVKVIDMYISLIRRKTDERLIETLRGVGYRLGRDG